MIPGIITIALLAIAAVGVWGWIRNNRAHKLAKKRAGEEIERLAAEGKRADEKAAVEAKAREDARLQAEAEEQSRKVAEARENARLAEEQRVAAEELVAEAEAKRQAEETALADTQAREAARLKEEAEAKQRAEAEAREMARLAAEEEQQAQERARANAHETARVVADESRRHAEQNVEEAAAKELITESPSQPQPPEGKEAMSLAAPEVPPESTLRKESPSAGRKAIASIPEATEDGDGEVTRAEQVKPCRERAPVSPEDRGGRSRATLPKKEGASEKKRRPQAAKPEIVCFKRQREWVLVVELPDDYPQGQSITVTQDGNLLEKYDKESDCWRLAQLHGELVVCVLDAEDERLFKLPLGDEGCLVFKLCGDNRNRGRHVKSPSPGSCLAIVPEAWKRDEELAGAPPYEPEDVRLPGHRAHFFELWSSPYKLAFRDGNNQSLVIGSGGPLFQLVGERIHDASDNLGPLFAGAPPRISVANGTWQSVRTIVLGEEAKGAGNWRKAFKPNQDLPEQTMPVDLANRRAGWYFARFYDHDDELIDSLDFRFCEGLRQVRTQPCQPFPSADGHGAATVELQHEGDWQVVPSAATHGDVRIERMSDRTVMRIPAMPERDLTRWKLGPHGGPQVEIAFLVERVWWAVSAVDEPPSEWEDTWLILPVEDFSATSGEAIWLRLPRPRWTDCVLLGFQPERRRPYVPRVTERMVTIPLRDFSDAPVLADRTKDCALKVWVNGIEAVIAVIPRESTETTLDITRISACRMARSLTLLHAVTRGPMRQLLKETRRRYRRPSRSSANNNAEFVQVALCAVAALLQRADATQSPLPGPARRWKSKARLAAEQSPDAMRQVWRRYRELEGRTTGRC